MDCVWAPANQINHMKSETVVHGYCINALLSSMALKCRVNERGDKGGEGGRDRKWVGRLMRCWVKITSMWSATPQQHGKPLEIPEEVLISEKVLRVGENPKLDQLTMLTEVQGWRLFALVGDDLLSRSHVHRTRRKVFLKPYFISRTSSRCFRLSARRAVRWPSFSASESWVDDSLAFITSSSCFTFSMATSRSSTWHTQWNTFWLLLFSAALFPSPPLPINSFIQQFVTCQCDVYVLVKWA